MTSGVGAACDLLAHVLCDPDGKHITVVLVIFVRFYFL